MPRRREVTRHGTIFLDLPGRWLAPAPGISWPCAAQRLGSALPYGTLVNLVGCFAIGAVMHAGLMLSWSPTVRSAITIGFLGGLPRIQVSTRPD